uniref:Uncharacterized protein n=1 Tax=Glossina pallidipes TaxID=7398 RepID=A0A1A9ZIW6_GLOPL
MSSIKSNNTLNKTYIHCFKSSHRDYCQDIDNRIVAVNADRQKLYKGHQTYSSRNVAKLSAFFYALYPLVFVVPPLFGQSLYLLSCPWVYWHSTCYTPLLFHQYIEMSRSEFNHHKIKITHKRAAASKCF